MKPRTGTREVFFRIVIDAQFKNVGWKLINGERMFFRKAMLYLPKYDSALSLSQQFPLSPLKAPDLLIQRA